MELKTYQKQVMDDLSSYLDHLNRDGGMFAAWKGYWMDKDVAVGLGGVQVHHSRRSPCLHQSPHRRRKDLYGLCRPQTHF